MKCKGESIWTGFALPDPVDPAGETESVKVGVDFNADSCIFRIDAIILQPLQEVFDPAVQFFLGSLSPLFRFTSVIVLELDSRHVSRYFASEVNYGTYHVALIIRINQHHGGLIKRLHIVISIVGRRVSSLKELTVCSNPWILDSSDPASNGLSDPACWLS